MGLVAVPGEVHSGCLPSGTIEARRADVLCSDIDAIEAKRMRRLVSILIPAYNAQLWLAGAIESAVAQSYPCKEIIIVDDGSSDRTLSIANRFASETVLVHHQSNQGAAAARNTAFSLCQGDYIQWLDADDLLAPDKISRQMAAVEAGERRVLLSGSWGSFFYRVNKARFCSSPLWCDLSPVEWLQRHMTTGAHMQTATWLVSRELTEAAGPWDTRLLFDDDGEYFGRVQLASAGIRFIPEAKVYYRNVGSNRLSIVGRSRTKQDAHLLAIQLRINRLLSLESSERSRSACISYLQKFMFDFYPERPDIVEHMQQLASDFGGRLQYPKSSWKYAWLQALCGWSIAKRAHFVFPAVKASVLRSWDKALFLLEGAE
jgi:glycosyltransferase involved in cell wall biosynthesis